MLVGVSGGIALGAVINIVIERTTSGPSTPEEVFGDAARAPDDVQDDGSKGDGTKARDVQSSDARDEAGDARDEASDARDEKDEAESAEMK